MRICFPDARMQRVFNDFAQLEARFGAELATSIATRMAVLAAARNLGRVPARPPIRLRALNGLPGQYSVDLLPPRRLRFGALNGYVVVHKGEKNDAHGIQIEEIEVLGVE